MKMTLDRNPFNKSNSRHRVSVLLPFKNAEEFLDQCFKSIMHQSLTDFEVIAINDGSTDSSVNIVNRWKRIDRRIFLYHQISSGIVAALNMGLEKCSCAYVARMDADDIMHPDRLMMQTSFLDKRPDIDLVGSQVKLFSEYIIKNGYTEYIRWQNSCLTNKQISDDIYIESPLAHPSVMFRKSCILALGKYHHGEFPEDYDLWFRLKAGNKCIKKIPMDLLYWRDYPNRASRVLPQCSTDAFNLLRAKYLAQDLRLQSQRPLAFWGAGRITRKRCNLLIQKGFTPYVWIDIDPKKIGNSIQGVPVVNPEWLKVNDSVNGKPFVLCYVNNHGARNQISKQLESFGYQNGLDYLMVG